MKKQLILAFAMLVLFGFGAATFANTVCCPCCSGDSCPMTKKDASGKTKASCCDDCDCCKGHKDKTVAARIKAKPRSR